ncbi:hypothetical protein DL762_001314 [Monosporascus cannonballus]|uniref:FAD-binding domain-containing protein n=1 Tax=Monosporascus cannonballus TaxID=155416 RepID=A0ABY0HL12_9PEZI|nr:hypothetical protein DL762_001314 [Monosporascus cannonballus]
MTDAEWRPAIAILGAGIGGLAVAIGLMKRGVPVTIFEAEKSYSPLGAGIGLGPNSLNAMDLLDSRFRAEYDTVKTGNEKPEFLHCIFDALYAEEGFGERRGWTRGIIGAPYFTRSSAHRRELLQIMERFIPDETIKFGKRARNIYQEQGRVSIEFHDGDKRTFDAVVGCDGVKGLSRQAVLGDVAPEHVPPAYCGIYSYRGIIPMDEAKKILGRHAGDAKWFMAKGKGAVLYPITKGKEANFIFFIVDNHGRAHGNITERCTKEEMLEDLKGFDSRLLRLLDHARPLRWPIMHHLETPTYVRGRVCLLGDVAHASSPHQAAGAGQALEDAAILSHLLTLVKSPDQIEAALQVYDAARRPRAQKVVQTSYEAGVMYMWSNPEIGDDMNKIMENANQRLHWIWQHDLKTDIKDAEDRFLKSVPE